MNSKLYKQPEVQTDKTPEKTFNKIQNKSVSVKNLSNTKFEAGQSTKEVEKAMKKPKKPAQNFILKNKQELLANKLSQPKTPQKNVIKEVSPEKPKLKKYKKKKESKEKGSPQLEDEEAVLRQKILRPQKNDLKEKVNAQPLNYSQNWSTTNMNSVEDEEEDDAPLQLDLKLESIMGEGNFLQETPQKRKIPSFLQPTESVENIYRAFERGNMPTHNLNFDQSTIRNSVNNASILSNISHIPWNQSIQPQQNNQAFYNSSPDRARNQQIPVNYRQYPDKRKGSNNASQVQQQQQFYPERGYENTGYMRIQTGLSPEFQEPEDYMSGNNRPRERRVNSPPKSNYEEFGPYQPEGYGQFNSMQSVQSSVDTPYDYYEKYFSPSQDTKNQSRQPNSFNYAQNYQEKPPSQLSHGPKNAYPYEMFERGDYPERNYDEYVGMPNYQMKAGYPSTSIRGTPKGFGVPNRQQQQYGDENEEEDDDEEEEEQDDEEQEEEEYEHLFEYNKFPQQQQHLSQMGNYRSYPSNPAY